VNNNTWIKKPAPRADATVRLFCFPYAGGTTSAFRAWSDLLPSTIEVCAIQLPGREDRLREEPFVCMDGLVNTLLDVLQPHLDMPFAFYGHSMGTLIAFELARALRRNSGPQPEHLLVSGRCAPQIPDPDPKLHQLAEEPFIEGLRRYNGTPEAVLGNKELMDLLLPLLRADFTLSETYEYRDEPPLDCPVSVYAGSEELDFYDPKAWGDQTASGFDTGVFEGDHFFIHSQRQQLVSAIADTLSAATHQLKARTL